ncbi:MAG: hypothetical protein IPO23_08050 [Flavobacterium sp.]|jgi:hypothetical protein|nr:hypothetical protein [Flavobacterium sp.]
MGKYLQNIEIRNHHSVTKNGELENARILSKDFQVIESYFNKRLPKKIQIGNNIWRFIIWFTPIESLDKKTKIGGFCQDYYAFVDYKNTLQLTDEERIKYLLDIFIVGIERCCEVNNYPKEVFQEIFSEMKQAIENKTFG